jgi:flagellum-specific peptidoglycan hydrolase FlgJ
VNPSTPGEAVGANGIPDSGFPIPDAVRNIPDSGFPIPDSRPQADDSTFKIQDSRHQAQDSRFNAQDSIIKTQDPTSNGPSSTSQVQDSSSQVSNSRLLIPHISSQQLQFLLRVAPAALESERVYQIPAAVTLAQAILESATSAGWGSSSLFRIANNPFGIKYEHYGAGHCGVGSGEGHCAEQSASKPSTPGSRTGGGGSNETPRTADSEFRIQDSGAMPAASPQHPAPAPQAYGAFDAETWEIVNGQKKVMMAQFQRFPNLTEAFRAHAQLLCSPHYRPAFAVRHDWKQFAERLGPKSSPLDLEHCGYSTNPSYSAELVKLVTLYRLDDPRAVQWLATGIDPGRAVGSQ